MTDQKIEQSIENKILESADPYLLITAIKAKVIKDNKAVTIDNCDNTVQENIKKIKSRCNEWFSSVSHSGNDALNRQILLDTEIAALLTPDTLFAIFTLPNKDIQLNRRIQGSRMTIAGVLEYGFKQGLDVIKLLPNNAFSKSFNTEELQKQSLQYQNNTLQIVKNLECMAQRDLNINPHDAQFKVHNEDVSLSILFNRAKKIIGMIKAQGESKVLLSSAANVEVDEISRQSLSGFEVLYSLVRAQFDPSVTDLNTFVAKCFSNPDYMLDSSVTHLFYDRLHLEAWIEQGNETVLTLDKDISCLDVMQEMVNQCDTQSVDQNIKNQFMLRFRLVTAHLHQIYQSKQLKKQYPQYEDILSGKVEIHDYNEFDIKTSSINHNAEVDVYQNNEVKEPEPSVEKPKEETGIWGFFANIFSTKNFTSGVDSDLEVPKPEAKKVSPTQSVGFFSHFTESGSNGVDPDLEVRPKEPKI